MRRRTGVWLLGARGGLATTVIAGCKLVAEGGVPGHGLSTESPQFEPLELVNLGDLVFGGHEIRGGTLLDSARAISRDNGSIPFEGVEGIRDFLEQADAAIRPGNLLGGGVAIERLSNPEQVAGGGALREQVERIQHDLDQFVRAEQIDRLVVVNLASTEPQLAIGPEHSSLAALDEAIDQNRSDRVKASLIYSYAAIDLGHPYVNFTPSNAALVPAIEELARLRGVPFMGSDGKTGETLVKSALAPMFRHRSLRVLSWQGYNMLGDRDGEVLSQPENLASKVVSKDGVLPAILGYPVHTHVGIDYVPSLKDLKTAWDFIHFEGFLGHRMSMQFTWQGCDSILAAPLVLDMIRLTEFAARSGETGPMPQLACFFKSPHGVKEHDLHRQWESLQEYVTANKPIS
ncbi:MAG: inositol-3-phosphate synthase [Planctomycetota bacterium]